MFHTATLNSNSGSNSGSSEGKKSCSRNSSLPSLRIKANPGLLSVRCHVGPFTPPPASNADDNFSFGNRKLYAGTQRGLSLFADGHLSKRSSIPQIYEKTENEFAYNSFRNRNFDLTSFDASNFALERSKLFGPEVRKKRPLLKRYNSNEDKSSNFFSLSSSASTSESAESPASTNERSSIIKQTKTKKIERCFVNSSSSSSANTSPESTELRTRRPEYEVREFLERFSLPRVVKIVGDGKPVLVYKFLEDFTHVQARALVGKKFRERLDSTALYFAENYQGWFSFTNEKGDLSACVHSTVLQLVQEQVTTFLSTTPLTGYVTRPPGNDSSNLKSQKNQRRPQYVKITIPAGRVFKMRAVFQHSDSQSEELDSKNSSKTRRERDLANRYAQLIDDDHQEIFVPVTTKGEFFEISTSSKPKLILPGHEKIKDPVKSLTAVDRDCVYRLGYLLKKCSLPMKLKLVAGAIPNIFPKDFAETFLFDNKISQSVLLTCSLPTCDQVYEINCLGLSNNFGLKLSRTLLGYDSEDRLFKSSRLQTALAFCRTNAEKWSQKIKTESEFFEYCRSIRRNLEASQNDFPQPKNNLKTPPQNDSKVDVNGSNWFVKQLKLLANANAELNNKYKQNLKPGERMKSLERYKDMSKLLEERFGKKQKQSNPVKKSASFMFAAKRTDLESIPTSSAKPESKPKDVDTDDELSNEFQLCILENETGEIKGQSLHNISFQGPIEVDKSSFYQKHGSSLKELNSSLEILEKRPDLIPSSEISLDKIIKLTENNQNKNSFMTDRLCSEFHVKTKNISNKKTPKNSIAVRNNTHHKEETKLEIHSSEIILKTKSSIQDRALPVIDDLPYSSAIDAVNSEDFNDSLRRDENIYAEIIDKDIETGRNKYCECNGDVKRTPIEDGKKSTRVCGTCKKIADFDCSYVKLGSNGDSLPHTSDDEAIYNTLR